MYSDSWNKQWKFIITQFITGNKSKIKKKKEKKEKKGMKENKQKNIQQIEGGNKLDIYILQHVITINKYNT